MNERTESLMRIVVCIVSGIILYAWLVLIKVFVIVNFFITLISGKRNKDLARLSEVWNSQNYTFVRYMTFLSNERPFPFGSLTKSISSFK